MRRNPERLPPVLAIPALSKAADNCRLKPLLQLSLSYYRLIIKKKPYPFLKK